MSIKSPPETTSLRRSKEPSGYSDVMPILDHEAPLICLSRTSLPIGFSKLFKALVAIFVILVLALLILPWQQFIRGTGKVVAFDPKERSLVVEAPLSGRVDSIYVLEGQKVSKGDLLFQVVDNDPNLMENLLRQREVMHAQREAAKGKLQRLESQTSDLAASVPQAILIAEKQVEAAKAAKLAADQQFARIEKLFKDPRGLVSERDYELAVLQRDKQVAESLKAEAGLIKTRLDMNGSLEKVRSTVESARSDMNKVEKEYNDLEIKINQTGRQSITAPRDGVVFRVNVTQGSFVKSSTPMCVIIPQSENLVVEMWVDGNDMPLIQERQIDKEGKVIHEGSPVRLQFEGWPAIQFVGWPSVAVGTFGGEVIFVDATDDGQGMFRVLVAPHPDEIPDGDGGMMQVLWPHQPILRQGVLAHGWVLLERVPLWYEFWRQLNGFPPALSKESKVLDQSGKK
ncbi:MAG: HlyD family efflux transporter periplasmic adaptor subunit [Verrucomicrobia bacterium]|jgi:multidrug resistance efflux pump|nr:HlyD family efflux transporter periplasmic adaptor subunit [Verrucomicrobiota bacterium]